MTLPFLHGFYFLTFFKGILIINFCYIICDNNMPGLLPGLGNFLQAIWRGQKIQINK